jgi:hypothetical protein
MRLIGVGIFVVVSSAALFGQRGPAYGSLGGYGNVLYPGTGHAPNSAANTFPAQLGATVAGRSYAYPFSAPRYSHPGHSRSVIVPYPVFVGNGYYGGYAPDAYATPPPQEDQSYWDPNAAPSVVINQTFVPDHPAPLVREYSGDPDPSGATTMRLYPSPQTNPYADAQQQAQARRQADPQPTIYLLAFKDHNIVPALGFWLEGNTLHYVSVEHSMNQASLDLIDRDLSQRLNDERGVDFKLPKQQ